MILSARFLTNVGSVNSYEYTSNVEFTEGDGIDVYFQLIDSTKDRADQGFFPVGRRYAPGEDATLQVTIDNINDAKKVTRFCSRPYAEDPTIWKLSILASDAVRGTSNLKLTLIDGTKNIRGIVQGAFRVY